MLMPWAPVQVVPWCSWIVAGPTAAITAAAALSMAVLATLALTRLAKSYRSM